MSICSKISALFEGDVWAESPAPPHPADETPETGRQGDAQEPGNRLPGSVFHFTAWLKKTESKEIKRAAPVSLLGKKALIVDDNRVNLDIRPMS